MIYADNAATTKLSNAAYHAMLPYLIHEYGNPSSLHTAGQKAARAMQTARETIANCLDCSPKGIYFTSCGSEADNQAVLSAARLGKQNHKMHILSTAFEHHAVLGTLAALEKEGFSIEYLPINKHGNICPEQVENAIRADTCLVSTMFANNEIGSILPIAQIGEICHRKGVLFHTDAVQAAGHLQIRIREQHIDLLTISAHKFHGPKGIGALYARPDIPLSRILFGGAQERGMRAGTENVPAIVGMAAALQEQTLHMDENAKKTKALRDRLQNGLAKIPDSIQNGDLTGRLDGHISICFGGIDSTDLLLLLDAKGICASGGSACAAGSVAPSHVLLALGRTPALAKGALRLTLDHTNTDEEVDMMLAEIPKAVEFLRGARQNNCKE